MPYIWDNTEADQYGIIIGYAKLHYIYINFHQNHKAVLVVKQCKTGGKNLLSFVNQCYFSVANTMYQWDPSILNFSTMQVKPWDNINKAYRTGNSTGKIQTEITHKKHTHTHTHTDVSPQTFCSKRLYWIIKIFLTINILSKLSFNGRGCVPSTHKLSYISFISSANT